MKQLTVLSHNAFWFQGVPFEGDMPPGPDLAVLRRLSAIYRATDPQVICLQEVQTREVFEILSDHLGMSGCYCPGTVLPQYGGAVFWQPHCGRPIRSSQESAVKTQRMWQVVEVEGDDYCLLLCNLHLPSKRQLGRERAAAQRLVELQDVIRCCDAGAAIVVGDFNEQPGETTGDYLGSHGYVDAGKLSGRAAAPTNIGGGRGDYVWVRAQAGDCLLTYDVVGKEELACRDLGKEYLSDHLPLRVTVKA